MRMRMSSAFSESAVLRRLLRAGLVSAETAICDLPEMFTATMRLEQQELQLKALPETGEEKDSYMRFRLIVYEQELPTYQVEVVTPGP